MLAAILLAVPLIVVGVVGVRTCVPLQQAGRSLDELESNLGEAASYAPSPTGEIAAERLELFLDLRAVLVTTCDDYGAMEAAFDSVAALESKDTGDWGEVGTVAGALGGAAFEITPFLARFFEMRNEALLEASMGFEEYAYIYAVAYREQLLSEQTRDEIFSDGVAVSPEASQMLSACLLRQLERGTAVGSWRAAVEAELARGRADSTRLVWQEDLPQPLRVSLAPYRARLDEVFCGATAGLEMERSSRRAIAVALE